jgi:nucleotide-binding universal stress UspA family protein
MERTTNKQMTENFVPVKMKKVLIALDYDPSAQKVAESGYSLAKAMNAEVILLHIVEEMTYYSSLEYSPIMGFSGFSSQDSPNLIAFKNIKEASKQFLEKSKLHLGDQNIQTVVEEGSTANIILETAEKTLADVIVLGSHSRRGLEKILMGSVAEKVLNHTTKPLFIIQTKKY